MDHLVNEAEIVAAALRVRLARVAVDQAYDAERAASQHHQRLESAGRAALEVLLAAEKALVVVAKGQRSLTWTR